MTEDTDISKGVIFRRHIKGGVLLAKTVTLPFGEPNMEYEWKLDSPMEYPDAIAQHQYLTKRYTRNIGMFDVREHAADEMCEDLQYEREQIIRASIVVAFGNRDTPFRKYIMHPTGANMDRLVMKSVTFPEKYNLETDCAICDLPYDVPKIEIIKEKQLISRVQAIQHISFEGKDICACRTNSRYYTFEANPANCDETFKPMLEAILPKEIVSADLSPHICNESAVLLEDGLLYLLSKQDSSRISLPEQHKWVSVIFGPHPRFVICASEKTVFACQLTNGVLSSYEKLYRVRQDRIMCLTRHPKNPFIFALASLSLIFLFDTRQPNIPYLSICPELSGPIEMVHLVPFENDRVKVLVGNRDGEVRIFSFRGGIGLANDEAPNSPYQCEMLLQSDPIANYMVLLSPETYFSCPKRFDTNSGGVACLFLPSLNMELTYTIIINISEYGDMSWQQLIQTDSVTQRGSYLVKPTNEIYQQLLSWGNQAKEQYFRNFRIQDVYLDCLVETMEYFYANKILEWLLRDEDKCYTCYELELKFNNKNFPSLNKLYFQSGWTKYSNWAKCEFGNHIPSLRYTRVSFKGTKSKGGDGRLGSKYKKKLTRKLPDSSLPHGCSCQLTLSDYIDDKGELELPWEEMEEVPVDSSGLFLELWKSWPLDTGMEGKSKQTGTGTGTNRCLEVIEEISGYLEQESPVREEVEEFIFDQSNDVDNIPTEPVVAKVTEECQLTPFPEKGTKNKQVNKNSKDKQIEDKQTEFEVYSSDPEWPMEWTDFSNSSFPNYDLLQNDASLSQMSAPGGNESVLTRFPHTQSTPLSQPLSGRPNTPSVKKQKRKIGF